MNNTYLIPANSKKGLLHFSNFNTTDLIIFASGIVISILSFMIFPIGKLSVALLAIAPGCICAFLVIPIPYYHNIRTAIRIVWEFYTTRQRFIWKGWCYNNGEDETNKK